MITPEFKKQVAALVRLQADIAPTLAAIKELQDSIKEHVVANGTAFC